MRRTTLLRCSTFFTVLFFTALGLGLSAQRLGVASFQVDATPPLGSPLCTGALPPAQKVVVPLSARGLALLGAGKPIVVVAVDWGLIANEGLDEWREALAEAAGTTTDHVSVHVLCLHDAPGYDPTTERLLKARGLGGRIFDAHAASETIKRAANALRAGIKNPQTVTDVGFGRGKVEHLASNVRVIGRDGKVISRDDAWRTPEQRDAPEGVIDPYVRLVSLWDGNRPLVTLTFYAAHSEAYYNIGGIDTGFVGLARAMLEAAQPSGAHIHFDGAGADVRAGKYNDGSAKMQEIVARRLADGMEAAWSAQIKVPITSGDVDWHARAVALPLANRLRNKEEVLKKLDDPKVPFEDRSYAARDFAWIQQCEKGRRVSISLLRLGPAYILFSEGELFVQYQLAAEAMKPGKFVAMATYGGNGVGVVCTKRAYSEEGYQEEVFFSRTSAGAEEVMVGAIKGLLQHP
jgi:hypothetical protein